MRNICYSLESISSDIHSPFQLTGLLDIVDFPLWSRLGNFGLHFVTKYKPMSGLLELITILRRC